MSDPVVYWRKVSDLSAAPELFAVLDTRLGHQIAIANGLCPATFPVIQHDPTEPQKCGEPVGSGERNDPTPKTVMKWP
jgi:hypothetical protein